MQAIIAGQRCLCTADQGADDLFEGDPILLHETGKKRNENADERGEDRGVADQHGDNDRDERGEEENAALEVVDRRNLVLAETVVAKVQRSKVHPHIDGKVVKNGRKDRCTHDTAERNTQILHHQECGRSHDWRHDHAASGGNGLDCTGKLRREPDLLHHRNGEYACRCHIGQQHCR